MAFNVLETIRNVSTALLETSDPVKIPETHEELKAKLQEYMMKVKESLDTLATCSLLSPEG